MISKKFLTSSLVYTVSAALPTIASFLLLPYYTNTGLISLSDFGALSLYITFSLFIQVIAGLSFDFYATVAYQEFKHDQLKLRSKLAALNGYLLIVAAFIFLVSLPAAHVISTQLFSGSENSYRYLLMSVLVGIFNAHFRFYNSILISEEKPWRYFRVNVVNFLATVAFTLIILYFTPLTLEGPMWGRLLSCLVIFMISLIEVTTRYGISFDAKYLKPTWQFCFPLLLTALFQWVLSYSDRFIIKSYLFNNQVAIFDLAFRFTLLMEFLLSGLSSAMTTKIYGVLKELDTNSSGKKDLHKYFSGFNLVVLIFIPLNILFLPLILPVFISAEKYNDAFIYFGIISAGLITRSAWNLFIYPLHFFRRTNKLILINGISAIFQLVLSFLLISKFKLYGAAFAITLVKILQLALFFILAKEVLTEKVNKWKFIILPVGCIGLIALMELYIDKFGPQMHLIHLAELSLVYMLTFLVYKNELKELVTWLLKQRAKG